MEAPPAARALVGRQFLHYKVVQLLGAGGMGVVYKALDLRLDRPVALKFVLPQFSSFEDARRRFEQEARAASALDHPNIATVHGIEELEDGQMFIVMAFYEGETLSSKIHRGPLSAHHALDIAEQIGRGLSEAHQKQIIHRDIKPSNVVITDQGIAKIVDFGLACLVGNPGLTNTENVLGTLSYMSPEQLQGDAADHRTDIWALAVVFYEMLTGALPFVGDSPQSTSSAILHGPVPDLAPHFSGKLNALLHKALAKRPEQRYATVAEMVRDLAHAQSLIRNQEAPTLLINVNAQHTSGKVGPKPSIFFPANWISDNRVRTVYLLLAILLLLGIASLIMPSTRRILVRSLNVHRTDSVRRLAVLPFTNIGHDPSDDALCDGLMEVLTDKLSGLDNLQHAVSIVPPSEIRREKIKTPEEARRKFGANLVLEGSVQRFATEVRLSLNLIDPAELRQLGAVLLSEPKSDLPAIEDQAVAKLAQFLEIGVQPQATKTRVEAPSVPAAYETFLRGVGLEQHREVSNNLDDAIVLFQQTIETDPSFALAYAKLGEAFWLKYRGGDKDPQLLEKARKNASRALALSDQLPTAYVVLGNLDDAAGQHELAVQEFQRSLRLDERSPEAYQGLGRAYESLGRLKEAQAMLQKAIDLNPNAWEGYSRLAAFHFRQAHYQEAVTQYRHVIQIAPANAIAFSNLGAALSRIGKVDEATLMYQKSLGLAPSYAAYANLGTIYYQAMRYSDAARTYKKALALSTHDYRVWSFLAVCYRRMNGMDQEARLAYQQAVRATEQYLEANPEDPEALCFLANARVWLGETEEAERLATRAITLAPNNPDLEIGAAGVFDVAAAPERRH